MVERRARLAETAAMPQLINASPYFLVTDVLASARWYRDQLGFQFTTWGEPADFAIVFREPVEILLRQARAPFSPRGYRSLKPAGIDALLRVDDVDALAVELTGRGVKLHSEPVTRFYKWRELEVSDPDGYILCFAQDVA
jgi:catechol 2,3-dioxygenase-like lactoylglutathione lyase family enzyme